MDTLISEASLFITTHKSWAAVFVGLIAFAESIFVLGMLIPATPLMVVVGGLVGAGLVDSAPVLIAAIIGAVIGDIVSYFLGSWLGPGIVHRWPLRQQRETVARARLFFRRYGMAAVFLGRFFGPLRCTVPLVAGIFAMSQMRFQIANIASAIVWAPVLIAPGWLIAKGSSYFGELSEVHWLGIMAGSLVLMVVATVVIGRAVQKAGRRRIRAKPIPERQ